MQKIKKYIPLLCCIVLAVISFCIIGLVGGVEGKYYKEFEFNDTISLPKKTYLIHFINNQTPLVDPIKVNIKEYEETDFSLDPQENPDIKATIEAAIAKAETDTGYDFSHWINLGSSQIDEIPAGNTEDIILYPAFKDLYTAIFVDLDGNLLDWTTFTTDNHDKVDDLAETTVAPSVKDCTFASWEVHVVAKDSNGNTITTETPYSEYAFSQATDVTIYPKYVFDGDVTLEAVDGNGDGKTEALQVTNYKEGQGQDLVEIPNSVNNKPVTSIADGALAAYDDLHAVLIPSNITSIGTAAFADGNEIVTIPDWLGGGTEVVSGRTETVTIYYQGTYAEWEAISKADGWDNNLGVGSRVFFLDENEKVDMSKGYIELCEKKRGTNWLGQEAWVTLDTPVWIYHNHLYPNADQVSDGMYPADGLTERCEDENGVPYFHFATWTDYDGACDCGCGTRPDAGYWDWTLTFDYNDGVTASITVDVVNGVRITLQEVPTRDGYDFAGWYTAATDGTRVGGAGDSYQPTGVITLYAQWTPNK